jgi:PAS domain S-box-containing protein
MAVLAGGIAGSGLLDGMGAVDSRLPLLQRSATRDFTLVAIDAPSLQKLGVWPWSRALHAALIDRLMAASAQEIAFDVDFSARSTDGSDAALEDALARADGHVVLAAFRQPAPEGEGFTYARPLDRFRPYVRLASINVRPDEDGRVRRFAAWDDWPEGPIPTMATVLAGADPAALPPLFHIDFGIRPDTIPRLSFADVLEGRFDPRLVAGKRILVGATAIELGDIAAVPAWTALPGVLIEAVAAESILQKRMMLPPPRLLAIALCGGIVLLLGPGLLGCSWRFGLLVAGTSLLGVNLMGLVIERNFAVVASTAPYAAAIIIAYASSLVGRIEQQGLRLFAQGRALDHSELLTRNIADHAFDGLIVTDAAGIIQTFNPAAVRMFGIAKEIAIGRSLTTLFAGDASPPFGGKDASPASAMDTTLLAQTLASGAPREVIAQRAGGGEFPADLAVAEMRDGEFSGYVALVRDISARKRAEATASRARQRLLDAIESIAEGFALYDAQDRLVHANRRYRELFSTPRAPVAPGRVYGDIMRDYAFSGAVSGPPAAREVWWQTAMAHHGDPQEAFEHRTAEGHWLLVGEQRTAEGGIAVVVADITAAKERESDLERARKEAELANRGKSEFLANMSHELRTPLNAIIGFSELMEHQTFGPLGHGNYRDYAHDIRESGQHLLDIINDVLDLSRIEAGKLTLNEAPIDLDRVLAGTLRIVQQRAHEAELAHVDSTERGLPPLHADERIVKQCLINLLSNAIKFTPKGGRVELTTRRTPEGGLCFEIIDNGIGIAAGDLDRVMAPFVQADGSHQRRHNGTGLGLPLVKSFMTLHGGRLDLTSELGVGTRVAISFPAHRMMPPRAIAV